MRGDAGRDRQSRKPGVMEHERRASMATPNGDRSLRAALHQLERRGGCSAQSDRCSRLLQPRNYDAARPSLTATTLTARSRRSSRLRYGFLEWRGVIANVDGMVAPTCSRQRRDESA